MLDPKLAAIRITKEAAQKVDELVFHFGYLEEGCPERQILQESIANILTKWAEGIYCIGGIPGEHWQVELPTSNGLWIWQYPISQFQNYDSVIF